MPAGKTAVGLRSVEHGGRKLTEALNAVDELPALAESVARLLRRVREGRPAGDLVGAVESDPALAIWVLRAARAAGTPELAGVAAAVAALPRDELASIAASIPLVDYFEQSSSWGWAPQRLRLHAVAVQSIVDRVSALIDYRHRDELLTAALLHDVGKLAFDRAHPGFAEHVLAGANTPEERVTRERRHFGLDHATVAGVLAQRWGLSRRVCVAIQDHHADSPGEGAAIVGLADMLAHHAAGEPIAHRRLVRMAHLAGLRDDALRELLYGLAQPSRERPRRREPSPLSPREREVLRLLAEGKRYKQIGAATGTSESTVRTHINNLYKKLGVIDRAQAVLTANERGWI